jgi:circadian clock protein KaiB
MKNKISLRLYVTGHTPNSERAVANMKRICKNELEGQFELTIIDVLERPQLAEDEKILATPTLIKALPPPLARVIGDLSNTEKVLIGLNMEPIIKSVEKVRRIK